MHSVVLSEYQFEHLVMFSAEAQHGCHRVVFEWGYTGLYLTKDILAMWSSADSHMVYITKF